MVRKVKIKFECDLKKQEKMVNLKNNHIKANFNQKSGKLIIKLKC